MAQTLVSQYWNAHVFDMLDFNDGSSGINDVMHTFEQPTKEDTLLWICKVKGSLSIVYPVAVNLQNLLKLISFFV